MKATLQRRGYRFTEIPSWGSAQAIVVDPRTGVCKAERIAGIRPGPRLGTRPFRQAFA